MVREVVREVISLSKGVGVVVPLVVGGIVVADVEFELSGLTDGK